MPDISSCFAVSRLSRMSNVQCRRTRFKSSFSEMEPLNKRRSNDGVTGTVANVSTQIILIEFRIFL